MLDKEKDLKKLEKKIKSKNWEKCLETTIELKELAEQALPMLLKLLEEEKNWWVRYCATDVLGSMGKN